MEHKEPYQEMVENTMFILLGKIYECRTNAMSEHFDIIPPPYKACLDDAIICLLYEEWIIGEFEQCQRQDGSGGYKDIFSPQMTQKGREWYQQQVIKNTPKWQKLFQYVGKRLLDKAIDTYL